MPICPYCPGGQSNFSQLKEHIRRVHKRERNHQCSYLGCDKAYFKKYDLKCHIIKEHEPERKLRCGACEFTTHDAKLLRAHVRAKHNGGDGSGSGGVGSGAGSGAVGKGGTAVNAPSQMGIPTTLFPPPPIIGGAAVPTTSRQQPSSRSHGGGGGGGSARIMVSSQSHQQQQQQPQHHQQQPLPHGMGGPSPPIISDAALLYWIGSKAAMPSGM